MNETTATTHALGTSAVGVDIIACCVADPERAIRFYRETLGVEPTQLDEHGRGAEFTLADGSTFGVWKPDASDARRGAVVMFAFPDVRATVERLRAQGIEASDPFDTGACIMAQANDPEGNPFIIHQRTKHD